MTVTELLGDKLGMQHQAQAQISLVELDEKKVAVIKVEKSKRAVYFNHEGKTEFYVRANNTTQPLDHRETHEYIDTHFP